MKDAMLAVAMRPRTLNDFIGQDKNIHALREQVRTSGIPHTILIVGDPGTGKTSMANILAASIMFQSKGEAYAFGAPTSGSLDEIEDGTLDFTKVNASNNNGVEDIREMLSLMKHVPMVDNSYKVMHLEEAHSLSKQAQQALLEDTENPPAWAYWIFSTSKATKLDAALRRRCYVINMAGYSWDDLHDLIGRAWEFRHDGEMMDDDAMSPFLTALKEVGITSPGVVLQCAERWMNGLDPRAAVTFQDESKLDVFGIAQRIAKGDWPGAAELLSEASKEDAVMLRMTVSSYLKTAMLKKPIASAVIYARAIQVLAAVSGFEDTLILNATLAALCGACSIMGGK